MKNLKRYEIIKASCYVYRRGGICEIENFSFLYDKELATNIANVNIYMGDKLDNVIEFYNRFCPEDYVIIKKRDATFEKVGELWL